MKAFDPLQMLTGLYIFYDILKAIVRLGLLFTTKNVLK